jgi:hypothetical protein
VPVVGSGLNEPLESAITKKIIRWINTQEEAFAWKVHGGPLQMGGIPDVNCCWKGRFVGIEVKRPSARKRTTLNQEHRMAQIRQAGGIAFVACSLSEVKKELNCIV